MTDSIYYYYYKRDEFKQYFKTIDKDRVRNEEMGCRKNKFLA